MSFDPVSYAAGKKAAGGGGGNPNYAEIIEGTLDNPWGDVDPFTLASELIEKNTTAILQVDGSPLGFDDYYSLYLNPLNWSDAENGVMASAAIPNMLGSYAEWDTVVGGAAYGNLLEFWGYSAATEYQWMNMTSYASTIPTTLTIIHHPISGGSGVIVGPLSVSANGTYSAPIGEAFNPVTVGIPVYDGSISNA